MQIKFMVRSCIRKGDFEMGSSVRFVYATTLVALLGCGSNDDDDNTPYAGDGTCEKAPEGQITWTYSGSDPNCQFILTTLNAPDDGEDEDTECSMGVAAFVLAEVDGKCIASAAAECDGIEIEMQCIVNASGKGDCSAEIKGTAEGQSIDCTFSGKA
jgi:hypothetical protein